MKPEDIEYIVIHCSATPPSMDIGWREIDRWHRQRGWLKGGYHYVIRRDGTREPGRAETEPGAHARGYNSKSIGICMVGGIKGGDRQDRDFNEPENNFTEDQWAALFLLLAELLHRYPDAKIIGHNEVSSKACPSFDVQALVVNHLG